MKGPMKIACSLNDMARENPSMARAGRRRRTRVGAHLSGRYPWRRAWPSTPASASLRRLAGAWAVQVAAAPAMPLGELTLVVRLAARVLRLFPFGIMPLVGRVGQRVV